MKPNQKVKQFKNIAKLQTKQGFTKNQNPRRTQERNQISRENGNGIKNMAGHQKEDG